MLEAQIELENLFDKNTVFEKLYKEFDIELVREILNNNDIPLKFGITLLVQMTIHQTCNVPTLVGLMKKDKTAQETADLLLKCAELDLVEYSSKRKLFTVMHLPQNESLLQELKLYQYPLPLITEPKKINFNYQSGYYSYDSHVILGGKQNHHNEDICLDHINRLNKIKFSIDENVISFMQNTWKKKKSDTYDVIQKKNKALELFKKNCSDVYVSMLMHHNEFHFNHKYDKRGRTYCQGYHINYMGNQYQKAVVKSYKKEIIR